MLAHFSIVGLDLFGFALFAPTFLTTTTTIARVVLHLSARGRTHIHLTTAASKVAIAGFASWCTIALTDPAFPRPEPVSERASEVGEFIRVGLFACFRL